LGACSGRDVTVVSLLDQVSDSEPAGPWRLLFDVRSRALADFSTGLRLDRGTLVQTERAACTRLEADFHEGETVIVGLEYARRLAPGGSLEVRLIRGEDVVAAATPPLEHRWVDTKLNIPDQDADILEIRHILKPSKEFPLHRIVGLAVAPGTTEKHITRAERLLRWTLEDGTDNGVRLLEHKRFPLMVGGCTRDCIAMLGGDTLVFQLPRDRSRSELRFWPVGLKAHSQSPSTLSAEVLVDGEWKGVSSVQLSKIRAGEWRRVLVGFPEGNDGRSVRFAFSGDDEILAVGEPQLVPDVTASRKMNVILVDLDTMRADRLGCYGYTGRPTSARLESLLAAKGFFVFSKAYSPAPWTVPATAKFFTSRYLDIHDRKMLSRSYTTLAEILRAEGYYCIAFTGGGSLRYPGFEQGFHEYFWTRNLGKAEEVFPDAREWLTKERVQPFFLFLHTFEPHEPYTRDTFCRGLPHGRLGDLSKEEALLPSWANPCSKLSREESLYVEAAYDGGVREACDATAELFVHLDKLGLWDKTVVVVLSDHGEEFWDHFELFGWHEHSLYAEMINVPFILYTPHGGKKGMRNVDLEVSTVDLVPTLVDLLEIEPKGPFDGVSLTPALSGQPLARTVPVLATKEPASDPWRWPARSSRVCVVFEGRKYIEPMGEVTPPGEWTSCVNYPAKRELFLLDEDPMEKHNLAAEEHSVTEEMERLLQRGVSLALEPDTAAEGVTRSLPLSPDLKAQLQVLGYVDAE
jgi:arylsulfatase A-like enzyme